MELKGTIKRVFTARQGVSKSGNEWVMQEFLLEVPVWGGTKDVLFTVSGAERIQRFNLKEGEKNVTVHFEVEARCFTNKDGVEQWRNDVRAYRLDRTDAPQAEQALQQKNNEQKKEETELPW